jgi:transposase
VITLKLTKQDLENIAEAQDDPAVSVKVRKKLLAVSMHHESVLHETICGVLRVCSATLSAYLKAYRDGGLPALMENRYYQPSSSLAPFWQCLICSFKASPAASAKDAVRRISKLTRITLSESQARRIMKKMGMKLRKCIPVPGKANHQLQFEFHERELMPRLREASQGKRKVFFVDASHFVLGGYVGYLWCFERQILKTPSGRQRYSILGAVDSHTKELITVRTNGNVNAMSVCELFYEIRRLHPAGKITLVMDNASYQHSCFTKLGASEFGIELLFLPPYSPNLNIIERLWKLVKKQCLTNRYYDKFAKFQAAIDQCLDSVNASLREEVESLLTLNFHFFGDLKT